MVQEVRREHRFKASWEQSQKTAAVGLTYHLLEAGHFVLLQRGKQLSKGLSYSTSVVVELSWIVDFVANRRWFNEVVSRFSAGRGGHVISVRVDRA